MELSLAAIKTLIVIAILLFVGYLLARKKIIDAKVRGALSDILFDVVSPAMIFTSFTAKQNKELSANMLIALALSIVSYGLLIGFGEAFSRFKNKENRAEECIAISYPNCGFMGIPIISALFGAEGVVYLSIYIVLFNVLIWTHGVIRMQDAKNCKAAETLKNIINPSLIAVALGLFVYFFKIPLPALLLEPIESLAAMNTPLAMIIAGAALIQTTIAECFTKKRIYFIAAFKLLIVPLIEIGLLSLFQVRGMVAMVIVVASACPTAVLDVILAQKYGKNSIYAAQLFSATTLLSVITIPGVAFVGQLLLL